MASERRAAGRGGRYPTAGQAHINGLHRLDGVRVVAVADCDAQYLEREKKTFAERGESLDTTSISARCWTATTSTSWPRRRRTTGMLLTIWACQAGKDVYIEKPVSHNVWEGRKMVEAARKYGRIVQAGTQSRSSYAIRDAVAWLRGGALGEIQYGQGLCYKPRRSIGKVSGPQKVPSSVDYNLWLGPAPEKPLSRKSLHYDWHWVFDTGTGDMGNQGIHQMDLCRWALGHKGLRAAS